MSRASTTVKILNILEVTEKFAAVQRPFFLESLESKLPTHTLEYACGYLLQVLDIFNQIIRIMK